jgi:hypothetical protein
MWFGPKRRYLVEGTQGSVYDVFGQPGLGKTGAEAKSWRVKESYGWEQSSDVCGFPPSHGEHLALKRVWNLQG